MSGSDRRGEGIRQALAGEQPLAPSHAPLIEQLEGWVATLTLVRTDEAIDRIVAEIRQVAADLATEGAAR